MNAVKLTLYVLAIFTSFACTLLLFRAYAKRGVQLLLWSAFCFVGLTINNILLFCDAVVFPGVDLRLPRLLSALAGLSCLLYAFIWKSDRKGNP